MLKLFSLNVNKSKPSEKMKMEKQGLLWCNSRYFGLSSNK